MSGYVMLRSFLVAIAAVSLSTWAQGQGIDYAKIEILTEKIAPNLYMLSGSAGADPGHEDAAGGRIGVLVGPDGIFMVDAQYAQIIRPFGTWHKIVKRIRDGLPVEEISDLEIPGLVPRKLRLKPLPCRRAKNRGTSGQ